MACAINTTGQYTSALPTELNTAIILHGFEFAAEGESCDRVQGCRPCMDPRLIVMNDSTIMHNAILLMLINQNGCGLVDPRTVKGRQLIEKHLSSYQQLYEYQHTGKQEIGVESAKLQMHNDA